MYREFTKKLAVVSMVGFMLSGCATKGPHNDVLIFGTSTKFALDVSAPVQNVGIPEFTLGYKRHEAVWMPLKPNGTLSTDPISVSYAEKMNKCKTSLNTVSGIPKDEKVVASICLGLILPKDKYVGIARGVDSNLGGRDIELDTYSVFASFGGSGNLSSEGAGGNLAQFFATGIAAQRLGANPAVGLALNSNANDAVVDIATTNNAAKVQAAADFKSSQTKAQALKASCLLNTTKWGRIQADPSLKAFAVTPANSTNADNLIMIIETDEVLLNKTIAICK